MLLRSANVTSGAEALVRVPKDCRPFESYEHDHRWLCRIGVSLAKMISELLRERCWQPSLCWVPERFLATAEFKFKSLHCIVLRSDGSLPKFPFPGIGRGPNYEVKIRTAAET